MIDIKQRMKRANESGFVLIVSFIIVLTFSVIGLSLAQTIAAQYNSYSQRLHVENAVSAAEAGISATIAQLNKNPNFAGYAVNAEQELYSDSSRGRATYTVSVSTDANQNKILVATGKSYRLQSGGTAVNTKQIRAVAALKRERISNSVIIGSGGVYMAQNSNINLGDVYIRGQLSMESGTSIGSVSTPVNLNIANLGCGTTGPSSNWPQPCGPSNPPIKMVGAGGTIYGNVCATDQVLATGITSGSLTPNCVSKITAAPRFNKKAFVEAINNSGGLVANGPAQNCGNGGTYTVPANTKFVGDVNLQSPLGICTINIEGDVYFTGKLEIGVNVTLKVADSLGTNRPTIVVNQAMGLTGTNSKILRNSIGTPMFLLTFAVNQTFNSCSASETIPSDTEQTCLTADEARIAATPIPFSYNNGSGTIDYSGAIVYGYYSALVVNLTNVTMSFYAYGGQGLGMAPGSRLSTVAPAEPFGSLLYVPVYRLIEYRQL
jgi:Tfp pilus assembly protein PilX